MKKIIFLIIFVIVANFIYSFEVLFPMNIEGKFGYINNDGVLILEPIYTDAGVFNDGRAIVEIDGRRVVIDEKGNEIFELYSLSGDVFSDGLLAFKQGRNWGFLDVYGKIVIDAKWKRVDNFSCGHALVQLHDKSYRFIHKDGSYSFSEIFDMAFSFSEGFAVVSKQIYPDEYVEIPNRKAKKLISGLRRGLIDTQGNLLIDYKYSVTSEKISDGLLSVIIEDKIGFINQSGEIIISPLFSLTGQFVDGIAPASTAQKYGLINKSGEFILSERYENLYSFSEGLAVFSQNGLFGYIDSSGNTFIPNKYEHASSFKNGLGLVKLNGNMGYVDKSGKEFWPIDMTSP